MKRLLLVLIIVLSISSLWAQNQVISKLKQPPPNKFGISDLWSIELNNTTRKDLKGYIVGSVSEDVNGQIVEGKTKSFTIKGGKHTYTQKDFTDADVNFYKNNYKESLLRTGGFPDGDYTICITVYNEDDEVIGQENCITHSVRTLSNIVLNSPEDNSKIEVGYTINPDGTPTEGDSLKDKPVTVKVGDNVLYGKYSGTDKPHTRVWGDPHVQEKDVTKWDSTKNSDFVLPDGTPTEGDSLKDKPVIVKVGDNVLYGKYSGTDKPYTHVWGDPHVQEKDVTKWDSTKNSDFVLPDGTRINTQTTSETGYSVSKGTIIFSWIPLPNAREYSLKIVELIGRQSPIVAMRDNRPFYQKDGIRSSTFQYPTYERPFEENKTYAWQVYLKDNPEETASEIWTFSLITADNLAPGDTLGNTLTKEN